MAKASIRRPVSVPPPPDEYVLGLTRREAEVLRLMMHLVVGGSGTTAPIIADEIARALGAVDVSYAHDRHKGYICFEPYDV